MIEDVIIRQATQQDVERLTDIWFAGWQDGHANVVPAELARLRTWDSFKERLQAAMISVRVAEIRNAILGFSMIQADELYQFYVSAEARGTGLSSSLMHDALETFRQEGVRTAWLACAIGNERAIKFYEKSGWSRIGLMTSHLPTQVGTFDLDVWRFEIQL